MLEHQKPKLFEYSQRLINNELDCFASARHDGALRHGGTPIGKCSSLTKNGDNNEI